MSLNEFDTVNYIAGTTEAASLGYTSFHHQSVIVGAIRLFVQGDDEEAFEEMVNNGVTLPDAYRIFTAALYGPMDE